MFPSTLLSRLAQSAVLGFLLLSIPRDFWLRFGLWAFLLRLNLVRFSLRCNLLDLQRFNLVGLLLRLVLSAFPPGNVSLLGFVLPRVFLVYFLFLSNFLQSSSFLLQDLPFLLFPE